MKTCTRCGEEKDLGAFGPRKSAHDGLYPWCRPCCVANTKAHQSGPEWRARKAEYDKARVARLSDRLIEQARVRYLNNREQRIADAAVWATANPDRRRVISMNYKSRRRSQEADGMTSAELRAWIGLQAKHCFWCDADCEAAFHVDHVYPLSRGGGHVASNLVIACPTCNLRKQAMLPEAWLDRILTVSPEMVAA